MADDRQGVDEERPEVVDAAAGPTGGRSAAAKSLPPRPGGWRGGSPARKLARSASALGEVAEDVIESSGSEVVLGRRLAGTSAAGTEFPVNDKKWVGRHSMSKALRMACAVNFGELASNSTVAPDAFNVRTWESIVGSVSSYDASLTIMLDALSPRPSRSPLT